MTEQTIILQRPGNSNMVVFQPEDDKFTRMKLTCGFTGEVLCSWSILKRDTPLMVSSYEAEGYRTLSILSNNNLNDAENEKEIKDTDAGQGS